MPAKNSRRLAMILALGLAAASCGGGDDLVAESDVIAAPTDTATEQAPPESEVAPTVIEPDEPAGALDIVTLESANGDVKATTNSALGGIRFERPADSTLIVVDDVVLVTQQPDNPEEVSAYVMLVTQLPAGSRIDSVERYLEVIELTHDVSPTGTAIVVGDIELTGYEITGTESVLAFASGRFPAPSVGAFGPGKYSLSFIGETASGVLDVGVRGSTREEAEAILSTLGTVLASLEFTGPGLDPALPPGEVVEASEAGPPPPPADAADDAPAPPLGPPFSPAETGRYELLNFGLPISLDFGEGWFIQPNFPGIIALTDPTSAGPNDRDVVFINSIRELVPLAGGPVVAGDAIPVGDIEELLSNPPEPMKVSEIERTVLQAENGSTTRVISFTVEIVDDRACSPTDPCELGLVTAYGVVKLLRPTDAHRVWWFPEHPNGPAAVVVSASAGSDWMQRAEELMATLELSR